MQLIISRIILIFIDICCIAVSLYMAYIIYSELNNFIGVVNVYEVTTYLGLSLIYSIVIILFFYDGIYTNRYDFWHESYLILKALFFSLIITLAYFGITKTIQEYSRFIIIIAFILMALLIPISKNITKKLLFQLGFWKRKARIYGQKDIFITQEVFQNYYLGYIQTESEDAKTIFINSSLLDAEKLRIIIENEMDKSHEVIFVPLLNDYDLSKSDIYLLTNSRTNLFIIKNRLKSRFRMFLKQFIDMILFLLVLPLLLPIFLLVAFLIKKEEPNSNIFFIQERLGQSSQIFKCFKFRTMYENSDQKLEEYLQRNPEEIKNYEIYHKYHRDPRITKIGLFLRKTSLDELPQIFNVFRGEMSFIGPRPYMLNEANKMSKMKNTVLSVKPGISGLWQVNGRNNVDFSTRLELDMWYVQNWSIWLDITIIFKTIKVVLLRKGAS